MLIYGILFNSIFPSTMNRSLLAVVASSLITGCAAIKNDVAFSEPADGERARVRIAIPSAGNGRNVIAYPNSTCEGRNQPGRGRVVSNFLISFEKTLNGKKIGMPKTEISENGALTQSEIYVTAGQPLTLDTFRVESESVSAPTMIPIKNGNLVTQTSTRSGDACSNTITFVPVAGHDYEIIFGAVKNTCSVSLQTVSQSPSGNVLTPHPFVQAGRCPKR